jgi:hypothetical protein
LTEEFARFEIYFAIKNILLSKIHVEVNFLTVYLSKNLKQVVAKWQRYNGL